jgi:hypothetical protein
MVGFSVDSVEGRVTDIDVSGTEHFQSEIFRSRLAYATEPPFTVDNLSREQQILLQNSSSSNST